MQKNVLMLVIVAIVVVVAIVAVVLMMGNKGTTTPVTPTTPVVPTTPTTPTTPGGGTPTGPMECVITTVSEGVTSVSTIKIEPPTKMKMTAESMGITMTMITSDGVNAYIQSPIFGTKWVQTTMESGDAEMPTQEEINAQMANPPAGTTYVCNPVADIPDSEFQLPAGAQVTTQEELQAEMAAMYGDMSAYE